MIDEKLNQINHLNNSALYIDLKQISKMDFSNFSILLICIYKTYFKKVPL